jgi:serine/threonine protein kinase
VRVAHRDLKLENILLSGGRAVVGDFGLSRLLLVEASRASVSAMLGAVVGASDREPNHGTTTEALTTAPRSPAISSSISSSIDVTGQTGSLRYMAPEVWASETYSHKADVFSFAILAFELLSRERAYEAHLLTMEQVAQAVCRSGLRPTLPKRWPADLSELLARCWAQDADDRPDFAEIAVLLRQMKSRADSVPEGAPNELYAALAPPPILGCCAIS